MCGAVIGVSLLALALALAMESYGTHPSQLAAAGAMQSLAMRTLKREQWPVHGTSLLHGQRPRLFAASNSPLSSLPCMRWNVSYLRARGTEIWLSAFASNISDSVMGSAEFVLARGRESEFQRSATVTPIPDISLSELLTPRAERTTLTADWLIYHAGSMDSWADLGAEAKGLMQNFDTHDAPTHAAGGAWPASAINGWLGSRGVLATPHYDPSHNMVVQIFGSKIWLLWPPELLPALRLHPASHPSRRQTRRQLLQMLREETAHALGIRSNLRLHRIQ